MFEAKFVSLGSYFRREEEGMGEMDFDDVVRRRRSIRRYRREPVPEDVVWRLLHNAHRAPTAGNKQPQEFVVVRDEGLKRRLAVAANDQSFVAEAPLVVVVCADAGRSAARYGRRGYEFYSVIDASCVCMILLLSVANEGLGACFVGAFDDAQVSRVLGLPEGVRPIGIFPIGYPAEEPVKRPHIPLEKVVHMDGW